MQCADSTGRSATGVWSIGTPAAGATATLTLRAKATDTGRVGTRATAHGNETDLHPDNNTDSVTVYVQPAPTCPPCPPAACPAPPTDWIGLLLGRSSVPGAPSTSGRPVTARRPSPSARGCRLRPATDRVPGARCAGSRTGRLLAHRACAASGGLLRGAGEAGGLGGVDPEGREQVEGGGEGRASGQAGSGGR
ncbi:DUF11 domain-containing protein [Kitasatospora aureofaciens]|uniref:DUF11 domain-containing protein n=1 Tax=Kitasatospora aureofaciens TaxID=1894 RepID=UPI0036F48679